MEHLVAVAVALNSGQKRFFITWGRIQDEVDESAVEALVLRHAARYDLGGDPSSARVCATLQEARDQPYFFEALFEFAQEKIPFGESYDEWRACIAGEMESGAHLYFLGR